MNIAPRENAKLKVKKWGYFLDSPKRGPFLHRLTHIIKTAETAILYAWMVKNDLTRFWLFAHRTRAPDAIFCLVVDRWSLGIDLDAYF
jgi:hypothetical protein